MDTENKEINLPENIKEEIRKNITELKEILKDDKEFANAIIWSMFYCPAPYRVSDNIYGHYSDIVKKCQEEHKPIPEEIHQLYKIVSFLAYLAVGQSEKLYDIINDTNDNVDIITNKIEALGKLCLQEIGFQFDPNINYRHQLDLITEYENTQFIGENLDLDDI